jgi:hypothetical protein
LGISNSAVGIKELVDFTYGTDGTGVYKPYIYPDGLELYVTIQIQGDGLGYLNNSGYDQTQLTFVLHFDQTQIPTLIKQLELILNKFPIKK